MKPDKAWVKGDAIVKKAIFNLVFEKNIKVTDGKVGTAEYALPIGL